MSSSNYSSTKATVYYFAVIPWPPHENHSLSLSDRIAPSFCPLFPSFWPKYDFSPVQVGLTGACPEFCVEIYQPVCGSNGETYSNGCYLQMVTCNFSIFKAMITITWNLILNGIFQAACASTTPITEAYQGECAGISMLMFPTLIFLYNNTKMIFLLRMSCWTPWLWIALLLASRCPVCLWGGVLLWPMSSKVRCGGFWLFWGFWVGWWWWW